MSYHAGSADIAVIGAGHAGIEAALAAARLNCQTLIFTINLDAVGNMPCNPAIGGTGKGQLVFEIDALGGEMGYVADKVTLQSRILNSGKGAAVHSSRVQADRMLYRQLMKETLENQQNLSLIQAEITDVLFENNKVCGVQTALGAIYDVKCVVICTGTYLDSKIIIGEYSKESGPDGMLASNGLKDSLFKQGIEFMRFKTGTPPRIHSDSVDMSVLDIQPGDDSIHPYSIRTNEEVFSKIKQIPCHIVYTNERTHTIIRNNLDRSPLYSGKIHGIGPRYCPSIEDKVVRFADKERHQLFLEPTGKDTKELYLQGFSSSLPEDVQMEMLHTLPGFEHAQVMRSAYAIEYECINPTQLNHSLQFKNYPGLFGAGQFNGTSGYEEAAAQGLIAGINAAMTVLNKPLLTLPRSSSYIGTLIDDLVTKGTNEPYRMMTSRTEFRLLLRQDNADERLCNYGYHVGLLPKDLWEQMQEKINNVKKEIERINSINISPKDANPILESVHETPLSSGAKLGDLLKRPLLNYNNLESLDPDRPPLSRKVKESAEIEVKYEGYITRQLSEAKRIQKLDSKYLPQDIDYNSIPGLRLEARSKLNEIRPETIGQAGRISGVNPADIAVLLIYLGIK